MSRAGRVLAGLVLVLSLAACGRETEAPPVAATPIGTPAGSPQQLDTVPLEVGGRTVEAELAITAEERQVGLMHRESMPADAGMLFLFAAPRQGGFWMKNTLIPLSIAYMRSEDDDAFRIVSIMDMQPCEEDPCPVYDPGVTYDAALEVNEGWFARAGVDVGDVVRAAAPLPTPGP